MNVFFLSLRQETPMRGYWDYGFLEDFISGNMWKPDNFPVFEVREVHRLPKDDVAIVVLPARHHRNLEEELNKELSRIKKVVLFLMGDEEAEFKVEEIQHDNIDIWIQNPHPGRHDQYNKIGTGYPPQSQEILPTLKPKKDLNLYFSGQITHDRRVEMIGVLNHYESEIGKSQVNSTKGFTQGVDHKTYYEGMVRAKAAPAPSGAVIPDSFRLFEGLESMAVPIADEKSPDGKIDNYWDWLFGETVPFPRLIQWDRLYGIMHDILENYPKDMHQITCWWIAKKREFAYKVCEQLNG